jgi:Domain of unknown function (DUF4440)
MKRLFNFSSCLRVLGLAALVAPTWLSAHPVTLGASSASGAGSALGAPALQPEIYAFRARLQAAAVRRDATALQGFYTEDFTRTHTSGKVDGKTARIASLLAAEPAVETAPVPELSLSCFGKAVCIARALSPIKRGIDGKWFDVRWTQTYVKTRLAHSRQPSHRIACHGA